MISMKCWNKTDSSHLKEGVSAKELITRPEIDL